uniref:Uncharacterized protein n=1 Tax=Glossina pallidipes TaxID=7398 RepID=A0A1A9ZD90_GLOPL
MDTITENPESRYNIHSSNEHLLVGDIHRRCEFTEDAACQQLGNARVKIESNDSRSSENEESQVCASLDDVRNTKTASQFAHTSLCTSIAKLESDFEEGELVDTNDGQRTANTSSVDNNCESNCEKSASLVGRIRVKSEFCLKSDIPAGNSDHIPQGYLDDLLEDLDEKTGVVKLEAGSNQDKSKDNVNAIPDNFFDDILVDQVTERIEAAITEEVEVKLSQRLEVLKELTLLEDSNKNKMSSKKKQHNKARKRSRKHSHSSEEEEHLQKRYAHLLDVDSTHGNSHETLINPTSNILTPTQGFPCGVENTCENTATVGHIKLEKVLPTQESEGNLTTSKKKIDIAILRACKALDSFRKYSQKHIEGEFIFTSSIRKLPTDSSFGNRNFYGHRSCLHSVNNVSYKFSSLSKRLNMLDWGLEAPTSKIARTCQVLCYDIYSLFNKSKSMKLPPTLLSSETPNNSETRIMDYSFSLTNNVSTQTDDDDIFNLKTLSNVSTYDAAVQSTPLIANIAVQTAEETSLDDLPIISIIRSFDSNQLMALHDFAELLRQQRSSNATHMYRVRERMVNIYNRAHMQSGSGEGRIQASQRAMIRNHRFDRDGNAGPIPAIENVVSSDGAYYATDTSRMILQRSEESREYAHLPLLSARGARSARQPPSSSTFVGKSYGRGCIRR